MEARIRPLLVAMVVLLVAAVLAGCAQPAPSPKPSPASPSVSPAPAPSPKPSPASPSVSPAPSPSPSAKLPQGVTIAVRSTTVMVYRHWVPIAQVISKYSGMKVEVKPLGTHNVYVPMLLSGDVEFGASDATSTLAIFSGDKTYWADFFKQLGKPSVPELRLVTSGPENGMALYCRPDRGIKTWSDLAGKKIYCILPGGALMMTYFDPLEEFYGLKGKVTKLQLSEPSEGMRAVIEGKADGWVQSPGPQIIEARATLGGLVILPVPDDALAYMQKTYPVFDRTYLKASDYGLPQDVPTAGAKSELLTTNKVSSDVVYAFLKAMYSHYDEYKGANPDINDWSLSTALLPSLSVPVHEGAIKFFKEVGVWNAELERQNSQLLKSAK